MINNTSKPHQKKFFLLILFSYTLIVLQLGNPVIFDENNFWGN